MSNDDGYIDDDRDTIIVKPLPKFDGSEKPRLDVYGEIEKAIERDYHRSRAEAGVTIKTKHVEATGFWQRTREGLQSFGARIRASWGGK